MTTRHDIRAIERGAIKVATLARSAAALIPGSLLLLIRP